MISPARFNISAFASRRRTAMLSMVALVGLLATACGVQESNTYPVEIFSEMHYSQAQRAQEPPRLLPPAESVAFEAAGGPGAVLDVPAKKTRPYNAAVAAELFRVNCAVCHGVNGEGDGRTVAHLRSDESYYATHLQPNGQIFQGPVMGADGARRLPPNLQVSRTVLTEDGFAAFIASGGASVMPQFSKLLKEEEIWDIVTYVYDTQNGLGTAR